MFLVLLPPAVLPVRAQDSALVSDTLQLAVTLAPDEHRDVAVRLTNSGPLPVLPLVYEAYPRIPVVASAVAPAPLRATLPQHTARIDPQIENIAPTSSDGRVDVLVFLDDQADLSAALTIPDWKTRGTFVYQTLTAHAERTQALLRADLKAQGIPFRPLWIVNAIRLRARPQDANVLATHPEVALVQADRSWVAPLPEPLALGNPACSPDNPNNPVCWNIRAIGADRVWNEFGINGRGVTVASIDSGVLVSHSALTRGYRGYVGPGVFTNDYNWYDPQGLISGPGDQNGHGTHVMGIMVGQGDETTTKPSIGVAPGAAWIAAQGCESDCSEGDLIAAAEWMLAPTDTQGRNPRPDLRPMVINNSWAGTGGDPWYSGYITAWRAAGIFPVFAAGNASIQNPSVCGSIASPGDDPQVLAVGAIDANRTIAPFSLRGPSSFGGLKPDLSAPGTYSTGQLGIYSAAIGGTQAEYRGLQGTSMAAPHVAGAVALLWAANPALIGNYDATYAALTGSAHPLADTSCGEHVVSPNNTYGYGALDIFAAVAQVRVDVPWLSVGPVATLAVGGTANLALTLNAHFLPGPGTYQARIQIYPGTLSSAPTTILVTVTLPDDGTSVAVSGVVTSAENGMPLVAQVGISGTVGISTDSDGRYTIRLFPGKYKLVAGALSYFSSSVTIYVSSQNARQDFALRPDQPRLALYVGSDLVAPSLSQAIPIPVLLANSGTRTLTYQVYTIPEVFSVWRSDEPGGPTPGLVALPADAEELTIPPDRTVIVPLPFDFRFFNKSFHSLYVGANGVISFVAPVVGDPPTTGCRPDPQLYLFSAAPFWANLDLSRGGRVRSAILPNGAAIVSYEQVLLRDRSVQATYSFQVELNRDGRVVFRYGELGALPQKLTVGVQRVPGDDQTLGCGTDAPLVSGLAIELRPQPVATRWLTGGSVSGSVAAGSTQLIPFRAGWIPPGSWPYRGRIRVFSSDPTHPVTEFTITSNPIPAPNTYWVPVVAR